MPGYGSLRSAIQKIPSGWGGGHVLIKFPDIAKATDTFKIVHCYMKLQRKP